MTPGVIGLLGPNGAGKTTLLRILATVLGADAGSVRIYGRDPSDGEERTEIPTPARLPAARARVSPRLHGVPIHRLHGGPQGDRGHRSPTRGGASRARGRRPHRRRCQADSHPLGRPAPSSRAGAGVAGIARAARARRAYGRARPRAAGVAAQGARRARSRVAGGHSNPPDRGHRRVLRARNRPGQRLGSLPRDGLCARRQGARTRLAGRRRRPARPGLLAHRDWPLSQPGRRAAGSRPGGAHAGGCLPPAARRHRPQPEPEVEQ